MPADWLMGFGDHGRKIKDVQAALELIYKQTHAKK